MDMTLNELIMILKSIRESIPGKNDPVVKIVDCGGVDRRDVAGVSRRPQENMVELRRK